MTYGWLFLGLTAANVVVFVGFAAVVMHHKPGPGRREKLTVAVFAASLLQTVITWLVGFSLQAPLSSTDIEVVKVSGMFLVFDDRIPGLITVAFLLVVVAAAYAGILWALRRGFPHSFTAAIVACVLASLSLMPLMPLTSPDAVHLAADVRTLWLHHTYPASSSGRPSQIDDPIAQQVIIYYDSPSGYGPLAYFFGGAPLPFVGDNLRANVAGEKAVAGAFFLLTAVGAGLVARRLGQNPGLATAAVGLNPFLIWQFPADGHNDSIMAAFGVVALLLLVGLSLRERVGGAALGVAAVLSKFGLAVAAPVIAAAWYPRFRAAIAFLVLLGGGLLALAIATGHGAGLTAIGPARATANITVWGAVLLALGEGDAARQLVLRLAFGLFVLAAAGIVLRHRLESAQDLVAAIGLCLFLFAFVGSPGLLPWYHVWYVPFALLSGRRWLVAATLVFSLGSFGPLLAGNWLSPLVLDMGISDPVEKSAVLLWIATGAVGFLLWRADASRQLAAARPATRRRRVRAAPARRRR